MKHEILLNKIANKENGGGISLAVQAAIKENKTEECIKMLKSMTFDNERLMIKSFGKMIVKEIKSAEL